MAHELYHLFFIMDEILKELDFARVGVGERLTEDAPAVFSLTSGQRIGTATRVTAINNP